MLVATLKGNLRRTAAMVGTALSTGSARTTRNKVLSSGKPQDRHQEPVRAEGSSSSWFWRDSRHRATQWPTRGGGSGRGRIQKGHTLSFRLSWLCSAPSPLSGAPFSPRREDSMAGHLA